MAQCPQCHSEVEIPEQSYGTLFTCPACQARYFVDWSGQPEAPQAVEQDNPVADLAPPYEPMSNTNADSMMSFPEPMNPPAYALEDETSAMEAPPMSVSGIESAIDTSSTPDFQEIVEFGNEINTHQSINYTIFVKGIEIAALRELFKEAITDSRFAWDAEAIMNEIKDGSVRIHDLSPAKAVILINRIKYLGLDVSWKQNVLS